MQGVKHETLTQCRAIVGPPSTTVGQHPVLGYRVVFDATLNVGQRHRLRANINPAFVQSIVGYYSHHEVGLLTKVEWILASNVRLAQHLTDIGSVSACTARPHPSKHEALNQCWFYAGPA